MNSKTVAFFVVFLTMTAIVIGLVSTSDSSVSTKLAYTNIDDASGAKVAKIDLNSKNKLVLDDEDYSAEVPGVVGGDADAHGCKGSAGYTWCEKKQKCLREWEEPCEQEIAFNFMKTLEESTKIDFSGIQPSDFIWETERGPFKIIGKRMDATKVKDPRSDEIHGFFKMEGFEIDPQNINTEEFSTSTGYKKGTMFCVVLIGPAGHKYADEGWVAPEPHLKDVEVYCGQVQT